MEWKNDILSFSGFDYGVAPRAGFGETPNECSKTNENVDDECTLKEIESLAEECEPEVMKDYEFDPMSERKIENFYFRNIEQAEKKMKKLTNLKSKLSDSGKSGDQIVAKAYLKPLSHENPWKTEGFQQKEVSSKSKRAMCTIS